MRRPRRAIVHPLVLSVVVGACASAAGGEESPQDPAAAERARLEAIYEARRDSARLQFTEADVAFMTGMIAHHAQAVLMSRLAPDRAASPTIRTLAARIINAQQDEISRMQQWLRERDQAVPEVHVDVEGARTTVHGADHDMDGPGMLTREELRRLAAARGTMFDRLFLRSMIRHHQGAVTMVHHLFEQRGAALDDSVFKLASDIQADQNTEIARMEQMLAALPGDPGSW